MDKHESGTDLIQIERRGHVFLIGFNRPEKRNAFNVEMLRGLSNAYTALERDPDARCGLVYAEGKSFTLGLELDEVMAALRKDGRLPLPEGNIDPWGVVGPRRSKPVVVAAHGMCMTLGIELMLAADIRLAAGATRFGQMEVQRGVMPFGGGTMRWVQTAGWGNAMRHMLTGEPFDAPEALRIGLIQEIVPRAELFERGLTMAELVASQAPLAVQATRESSLRFIHEGEAAAGAQLLPKMLELLQTQDAEEGIQSFKEKRAAKFQGK